MSAEQSMTSPAEDAYVAGDVVRLRSGGPAMTVSGVGDGGRIACEWFAADHELKSRDFAPSSLIRVATAGEDGEPAAARAQKAFKAAAEEAARDAMREMNRAMERMAEAGRSFFDDLAERSRGR